MAKHIEHREITHEIELDDKEFKKLQSMVRSWKNEKYEHMPADYYDEAACELFDILLKED